MLAVGMAMMAEPQLLLLDDISVGLAPKVVLLLYDRLKELRALLRIPILMVEQNVEIALNFTERGYVLSGGKICVDGTGGRIEKCSGRKRVLPGCIVGFKERTVRMKKKLLVLAMSLMAMMFSSLNLFAAESKALDPPGPGEVKPGEEIIIGGTFTLTGPVSHAGRMTLEGAERGRKICE